MNLQKSLEMSLLNEFYGSLLTTKQQNILVDYYYNNMSLAEIAENYSISRQAVRDSLVKTEIILKRFEDNLGMVNKYTSLKLQINEIIDKNNEESLSKKDLELKLKALLNIWEDR